MEDKLSDGGLVRTAEQVRQRWKSLKAFQLQNKKNRISPAVLASSPSTIFHTHACILGLDSKCYRVSSMQEYDRGVVTHCHINRSAPNLTVTRVSSVTGKCLCLEAR